MRAAVAAVLGIILIYAGLRGKKDIFLRIRGVQVKGFGAALLRIIYVISGIILAAAAFAGYFK